MHHQAKLLWSVGALVALTVLLLPGLGLAQPFPITGPPPPGGAGAGIPVYSASAFLGSSVGRHLNAPFYAVVMTTFGLGPRAASGLGSFLNSTPITTIRLSGGSDSYDPTTGIDYQPPGTGGTYVAVRYDAVNWTWFKAWCYSKSPHCDWLWYLPGESNDTRAAVHTARWFHQVLGFVPTYWQFGNEPSAWTHWGKNYSKWSTTDNLVPTGLDYATMVHAYIAAVHAVYPNDKFIGIEANCACNPSFVSTTTQLSGSNLTAMAYHSYPWLPTSGTSLAAFYAELRSPRNITATASHMRTLDSRSCARCTNLPIGLGEYNTGGPVPSHSPFALTYAGAPFLAASIIQAIDANVSMFTLFSLSWMYDTTSAAIQPMGYLYQRILANMTTGTDYPVGISAGGTGGVYALLVKNGSRESLLVVNTNNSRALNLSLLTTLFPIGLKGTVYAWASTATAPTVTRYTVLPTHYALGAQGILLLDNF